VVPYVFGNEHVRYWCTVARGQEPELEKPRVNSSDAFYRTIDLLTMVSATSSNDALLSLQAQPVVAFVSHIETCVVGFFRQAVPQKEGLRATAKNLPDLSDDRNVVTDQLLKYVLSDNEVVARVVMGFYGSVAGKASLHVCRSATPSGQFGTTKLLLFPPSVGLRMDSVTMNDGMVKGGGGDQH
jgi:hypothetical protein